MRGFLIFIFLIPLFLFGVTERQLTTFYRKELKGQCDKIDAPLDLLLSFPEGMFPAVSCFNVDVDESGVYQTVVQGGCQLFYVLHDRAHNLGFSNNEIFLSKGIMTFIVVSENSTSCSFSLRKKPETIQVYNKEEFYETFDKGAILLEFKVPKETPYLVRILGKGNFIMRISGKDWKKEEAIWEGDTDFGVYLEKGEIMHVFIERTKPEKFSIIISPLATPSFEKSFNYLCAGQKRVIKLRFSKEIYRKEKNSLKSIVGTDLLNLIRPRKYLEDLVKKIATSCENPKDALISLVKAIPYVSDKYYGSYPKTPIETLLEGGDCEDKSILLVSLLKILGEKAVFVIFKNHMGVGVPCETEKPDFYHSGMKYCYVETTARTGENPKPEELKEHYFMIIDPDEIR